MHAFINIYEHLPTNLTYIAKPYYLFKSGFEYPYPVDICPKVSYLAVKHLPEIWQAQNFLSEQVIIGWYC